MTSCYLLTSHTQHTPTHPHNTLPFNTLYAQQHPTHLQYIGAVISEIRRIVTVTVVVVVAVEPPRAAAAAAAAAAYLLPVGVPTGASRRVLTTRGAKQGDRRCWRYVFRYRVSTVGARVVCQSFLRTFTTHKHYRMRGPLSLISFPLSVPLSLPHSLSLFPPLCPSLCPSLCPFRT
jgi:hypothetical protein